MSLWLAGEAYLFCEPVWWKENKGPVHPEQHAWYPEWTKISGKAIEPRQSALKLQGVYRSEFERGWAVYHPPSPSAVEVDYGQLVIRTTTGEQKSKHEPLPKSSGLFLRKRFKLKD